MKTQRLPVLILLGCVPIAAILGWGDLAAWGGRTVQHWWIDAGWTLGALLAVGCCFSTAIRVRKGDRLVWALFTAGCVSWLCGQIAWDYYELFSRFPPAPNLSDLGYLGLVPCYIAGFIWMATGGRLPRILLLLDELILACAFAIITVSVFWADIIHTALSFSSALTGVTYPVAYGVLACSLLLVPTLRFWTDRSLSLLFLGVLCQVIPFVLWTPALLHRTYGEGGVLDVVWMTGMLALAASACTFKGSSVDESDTQFFGAVAYMPLVASLVAVILWLEDFTYRRAMPEVRALLAALLVAIVCLTVCRLALNLWRTRMLFIQAQITADEARKSEQRFRAIFEWAPVGIEIADLEGRLVATNSALQAMLGYTEAELSNVDYTAITHPDDIDREMELDEALVSGQIDHYHLEKRHLRRDGEAIWTRLTASEVRDADGKSQFAIGMVEDITARKEAEEALRDSEEQYRTIMETSPDAVISLDAACRILSVNPAVESIFGFGREDIAGRRVTALIPDILRQLRHQGYDPKDREVVRNGIIGVELVGRRKDGSTLPLEVSIGSFTHRGQLQLTCFLRDITERRKHKEQLQHQAQHDMLTGLPNRSLLQNRLEGACSLPVPLGGNSALLLMDLDRFKEINDTFGHPCGDKVLQCVASRLSQQVRARDTVARLGGDEFAILVPETEVGEARRIAERVVCALHEPMSIEGQSLHVDASIGIALFPDHGRGATELLRQADIAMYVAKRAGTRVAVYESSEGEQAQRRTMLVGALRRAIEGEELRLLYQPKASCALGHIVGLEALVRWQHPQHGLVPPDEFIPLAEHSGVIKPLTRWVLNEAVRQIAVWRRQDLDTPIWVNLSARTLHDRDLPGMVAELLERWGVEAQWLGLEVTESAVMVDPDRALEVLEALDAMGCTIAIDDFGRGYSSLGYLQRLPVTEIKIDRSFVLDMQADRSAHSIVRATINLAHDLGLMVVSEGVEDQRAWDILRGMKCDMVQGYFLSRPLPAEQLETWMRTRACSTAPMQSAQ